VNRNVEFVPHVDGGGGGGGDGSNGTLIVGMGDYIGGQLHLEGGSPPRDVRYCPLEYDGTSTRHWTGGFKGERYTLVWFTPKTRRDGGDSNGVESGVREEDRLAASNVESHAATLLPAYPPLKFRTGTTDALAINEILCSSSSSSPHGGKRCAYEFRRPEDDFVFSVRGHDAVLDVGAHVGAFVRYALGMGCRAVIAHEPEGSNLELLRENSVPLRDQGLGDDDDDDNKDKDKDKDGDRVISGVEVRPEAVSPGPPGRATLVRARSRNDGTANTWRHSLAQRSSYADRDDGSLPSSDQEGTLTRTSVPTVPLFGEGGALRPGVTFVKLDCEGAELDILTSKEASLSKSWLDVTHLTFEWSFTKERRVEVFHGAVRNLNGAGFRVAYEGQGAWWDTERDVMWPYHRDLVVYAIREDKGDE